MEGRRVYGLDIETDTAQGVDPRVGEIRIVALSTAHAEAVFRGTETHILGELDAMLADLAPGIIATWNGGAFDLPYLADRAALLGLPLGLSLAADPKLRLDGAPLIGHELAYRAAWYDHAHVDAARLFRSGRRPLIEVGDLIAGLTRRVHPSTIHPRGPRDDLSHDMVHAHAPNDARLARVLVERRRALAGRHLDRIVRPSTHREADWSAVPHRTAPSSTRRPPLSPAHPAVRAMLASRG